MTIGDVISALSHYPGNNTVEGTVTKTGCNFTVKDHKGKKKPAKIKSPK